MCIRDSLGPLGAVLGSVAGQALGRAYEGAGVGQWITGALGGLGLGGLFGGGGEDDRLTGYDAVEAARLTGQAPPRPGPQIVSRPGTAVGVVLDDRIPAAIGQTNEILLQVLAALVGGAAAEALAAQAASNEAYGRAA